MFKTIKKYYDGGFDGYTNEGVKIFVLANWITPKQYKEITGIDYVPSQ
ncbi:XkdX family protein [Bacillaceae bacterium SIJ1]|nr:XkdX family protein [Litoribacterium kuwaitense]NGP46918.1 XkdX family protein [Litoribacterium kuwaitense]